jgi:hypothetical protein
MHDRLSDQHPVKRVRVEPRKLACMEGGFLIHFQRRNTARFADSRDKSIRPFRKLKATKCVFDSDFPRRGRAQVAFILPIQKYGGSRLAQPRRAGNDPEKRAGVD